MKKSSEVLLVAAVLLAAALIPSLNAGEAGPDRADRRAALSAELGLTGDQKASLQALRGQERAALAALKADTSLGADEKRAQARAIREGFRRQAESVFTAEQQAKLQERRANHPGGRPSGKRPRKG